MFNQINHTQSHNRVTAIQIGEVGDILFLHRNQLAPN